MTSWYMCRFCRKGDDMAPLVKYGTRHHAHTKCLVVAKGDDFVASLPIGVVGAISFGALGKAAQGKLLARVDAEVKANRAQTKARERANFIGAWVELLPASTVARVWAGKHGRIVRIKARNGESFTVVAADRAQKTFGPRDAAWVEQRRRP